MLPVAVKVPDAAALAGAAARPTAAAAAARVTARERRQWIIRPLLCVLTDMAGPAGLPPRTAGSERRGGAHGWMMRLDFRGGLLVVLLAAGDLLRMRRPVPAECGESARQAASEDSYPLRNTERAAGRFSRSATISGLDLRSPRPCASAPGACGPAPAASHPCRILA